MKQAINLVVNGIQHELEVDTRSTLLEVLRDSLQLNSVHRSCGEGECGVCTVLVNGEPMNSCLILAAAADGMSVTTSEGLIQDGELHPLMRSFANHHGFQCGFCTSGILMTAYSMLNKEEKLTNARVRKALEGHMCRCTGYVNIVKSILAAKQEKDDGKW